MEKLKLRLDDLRIDSFDTTAAQKAKGTVFGEQCTCYTQCTCPGNATCDASCNGTCDASCNGTCAASCGGACATYNYVSCLGNSCAYSCEYTCGGWRTYGPGGGACIRC